MMVRLAAVSSKAASRGIGAVAKPSRSNVPLPITCRRGWIRSTTQTYQPCASKKSIGPPYSSTRGTVEAGSCGCVITS